MIQDQGGVVDRLNRRMGIYRKRHEEVLPRFETTVTSQNNQQKQETQLLRQRFLETSKAKKSAKKSEKKQNSESSGSSLGSSKSNKRQNEDDPGGSEGYEPPSKIGGPGGRGNSSQLPTNSANPSLYKQGFSQNGKRGGNKAKAIDSQKYSSASSSNQSNKNGMGRTSQQQQPPPPPISQNNSTFSSASAQSSNQTVPDMKKESISSNHSDLADLAAALEKDAGNGGITSGFLGDNSSSEIFNSDVFDDLLSDLSDLNPDVMSDVYCMEDRLPTDNELNDVALGGITSKGPCNSNESFHPVAPVTPAATASMRSSSGVSHGLMSGIKMEGGNDGTTVGVHARERGLSHCGGPSPAPASTASPLASQLGSSSHQPSPSQSYNSSHYLVDGGQTGSPLNTTASNGNSSIAKPSTRLPYPSPAGLSVDSPAAQTLKHMAEQHQHKAQMCMNTSSAPNGATSYKNQGSVGSPVGSPYGAMGNYNATSNSSADFSGQSGNTMNSVSNCQIKQEVCSPVNTATGFSPSPMAELSSSVKRPSPHSGSSPSNQSSRLPNMNSAGGSPVMSPISKSFNLPSPLNGSNSQGQIPSSHQPPQQTQPPPSYMPMNRLPGPPNQPYPNTNLRFPNANSSISDASPKGTNNVNERGSPASQVDIKPQLQMGVGAPNMMMQHQQQKQFPDQQFNYGNGHANHPGMEMGYKSSQMQPQSQQQQPSSQQTINFTQQHLRMGNQPGMHPHPHQSRMPMPGMNRMGVPQRFPGGHNIPPEQIPPQQQQQQQQQRPMMDHNPHNQRMIRPGQHQGHGMMPSYQQQMPMSAAQSSQSQMMIGPGGNGQMVNRFPHGVAGNPQMMAQQNQSYGMGGEMQISGPGGNPNMPMRRPYGPMSNFQGMNPQQTGDQMIGSNPSNHHQSIGNPGMPHNPEWVSNMNNTPDGSCPTYSAGPQRHPSSQQQMRPKLPPHQYNSGMPLMPPNQANSMQGPPPSLGGSFNHPHDNMTGQRHPSFVGRQNHHPQQQPPTSSQIPQNFNQYNTGPPPNSMKMGHHPQQQQSQSMYGSANCDFGMKPPDKSHCTPQTSISHHPQISQQQQQHTQPPPHQSQHSNMYNMGSNNGMMSSNGSQLGNNMISVPHPPPDQQDFNFDLLVNGIRNESDQDTAAFNDDLLESLNDVFK